MWDRADMFTRITSDPAILGGKPCVKGTRISVEMILEWIASGATRDDVVKSYPQVTVEDVEEALGFAAQSLSNEMIMTAEISS
jgi:uncharacterized protein (DUF433 family)